MKNARLLPIWVLTTTFVPLGLFWALSSTLLRKNIKSTVVNDPPSALAQSLNGLEGAYNQALNRNLLAALRVAGQESLAKALAAPTPMNTVVKNLGQLESQSSQLPLLLLADRKGNALYATLSLPKPTPSPSPVVSSKRKKANSAKKSPSYPNVRDWPGMDRALDDLNASGVLDVQGVPYLASFVPVRSHGHTLGVAAAGTRMDKAFLDNLKTEAVNDVAFYSQAQTLCTKAGPLPPLDPKTLSPRDHPALQWQGAAYLAGAVPFFGLDSKIAGYGVVFQPVKQTLTVGGSLWKDLWEAGFLVSFLALLGALVFLWRWMIPFHQLRGAVERMAQGDWNAFLPVRRPDEWGLMARGLQEMAESLREKERVSLVLGKVVDPQAAKKILGDKDYFALKGERRECTLLQADLKGFNTLSENMAPEALVEALNRYFSLINEIVFKYEGMLDKFMGDAALAVWGAPFTHPDKEWRAVRAALEIQEALKEFNISRIKTGHPPFTVGIGIHTGTVVSGNLGSDRRPDYSVIGEPLHVAGRLCSMAAPGQTVVSDETHEKISAWVKAKPLNPIAVKGSLESLKTYEVIQFL